MFNKYAQYATKFSAFSIFAVMFFGSLAPIFGYFSFIISLTAFGLSIKGMVEYGKDNTIGGLVWCIIAMLVSFIMLGVSVLLIIKSFTYYRYLFR